MLILLIIVGTLSADKVAKLAAAAAGGQSQELLFGAIQTGFAENHGGSFGVGSQLDPIVRRMLFTVGAGMVLLAGLVWAVAVPRLSWVATLAAGLLLGGGLGNWLDRLLRGGAVVDFINVSVAGVHTGFFNLADVAITVGALLVLGVERTNAKRSRGTRLHCADAATTNETDSFGSIQRACACE